jgi:hypothetical protein
LALNWQRYCPQRDHLTSPLPTAISRLCISFDEEEEEEEEEEEDSEEEREECLQESRGQIGLPSRQTN